MADDGRGPRPRRPAPAGAQEAPARAGRRPRAGPPDLPARAAPRPSSSPTSPAAAWAWTWSRAGSRRCTAPSICPSAPAGHTLHPGRAADLDDAAGPAGRRRRARRSPSSAPTSGSWCASTRPSSARSRAGRCCRWAERPLPVAVAGRRRWACEPAGEPGAARRGKLAGPGRGRRRRRMAFVVDEFLAEQEIVVKSLGAPHPAAAARCRGDHPPLGTDCPGAERGEPGPHRACAALPARSLAASPAADARGEETHPGRRRLGHHAHPGEEHPGGGGLRGGGRRRRRGRLALLQEHGADLLVSDVEMPRMDGFALTETVRGSQRSATCRWCC